MLACAAAILLAGPAIASASVLSGTVTAAGGSTVGLQGTTVHVATSAGATIADGATDLDGSYSVTVPDGTYDVTFSPPLGSGYRDFTTHSFAVSGDTVLQVVLAPASAVQFSGVLRDSEGHPLANQYVQIGDVSQVTDPSGNFSLQTGPGPQTLLIHADGASPYTPHGGYWSLAGTINLTADHTTGFTVPTTKTTITTIGPSGNPIPNSTVTFSVNPTGSYTATIPGLTSATIYQYGSTATTNADGNATLITIGDPRPTWDNSATPPSATGLPGTHFSLEAGVRNLLVAYAQSASDAAPPSVSCQQPDSAWHADEVSLACTVLDAGTGLANPADASFSLSTNVGDGNESANAYTGTRRVCDLADNCVTAGPLGPIKVDRQAPRITITQGTDGAHVVVDDADLDSVSCTVDGVPVTLSASPSGGHLDVTIPLPEGDHEVVCTAEDGAGHAPQGSGSVSGGSGGGTGGPGGGGDSNPGLPATGAFSSAPDGEHGWFRTAPATATVHVADVSPTDLACTLDGNPLTLTPVTDADGFHAVISTSAQGDHLIACSATDAVGHVTNATGHLKLDSIAPAVAIHTPSGNPSYAHASSVVADYSCSDATPGSGVASCSGDVADGAPLDTATTGAHTLHATVKDVAGNSASASADYTVTAAHSDYAQVVLEDDPAGYWRLGDGLDTSVMADETGHYSGEYKNGAGGALQQGISGDGNTVAIFAGNGTYGYINGIAAPHDAYTMEAWVYADDTNPATIMQHGGGGALYISGGRYVFKQVNTIVTAPVGPTVGHFDHVVGTWDGATASIYVNGHLAASAASTTRPSGSATFYIGYGDVAPWFRGYLDEAAYYPTALSAARVLAHFEADPPPPLWLPRSVATTPPASGGSGGSGGSAPTGGGGGGGGGGFGGFGGGGGSGGGAPKNTPGAVTPTPTTAPSTTTTTAPSTPATTTPANSTPTVRCVVPKLTNRKLKNARKRLDKAHCKTGKIHRKRSHKIHAGRVITTSPKVGTKLPADAAIAVTVSRGGGGRAHR
jgi:uncharacterized membrane protein YgcG